MAGLLDYLSYGINPLGNASLGLLRGVGSPILDFYKNQGAGTDIGGAQYDPMGSFTGVQTAPPPQVLSAGQPSPLDTAQWPYGPNGQPSFNAPQAAPLGQFAPAQPSIPNPIALGDYQMPRVGNPDLYEPQQVNTPANSAPVTELQQPQQQQLPPAFGRSGGGFFDSLNAGLQSIGNGGSLIGALTGNRTDPQSTAQQNLRAQYESLRQSLVQSGMSPNEANSKAMIAILNPKAGEAIFTQAFGNKEPPKTVEELMVRQAYDNRGRGGAGTNLNDAIQKIQEYKSSEKAAEQKAKTIAEEQGKRTVALPSVLARAKDSIQQIDELKEHPAKSYRTGFSSIAPAIPGTAGVDFDERVKQLKGGAFLEAYNQLRGTGAISEAEGIKAEQAQARLSQAKSQKDFDQALDDLRAVLVRGYVNAQQQAGEEKIKQLPNKGSTKSGISWSVQ